MIIIGGNKEKHEPTKCTVRLNNKVKAFTDFVTVGIEGEKISIMHNADAITLGIAVQVVKEHFMNCYKDLTLEQKKVVDDYFRGPDEQN